MSITKTTPCPSGLCRALFPVLLLMFQLLLPETGGARSACSFPAPERDLKIACNSLNLLKAEKRSHGYAFDKRYAGYRELRRDTCPNCPDPDKRRLAIMMAERQGGSAQAYYDKLTDPEFVRKRVEKNTAGLITLGTLFVPWGRILGSGAKGVGFTVDPNKFSYFFGRVTQGSAHNIMRSAQNLKDLNTLGIYTERQLMKVFENAFAKGVQIGTRTSNYGTTIIKSIDVGTKGKIEVSFFYNGGNISSTPSITTIIPKIFK